MDEIKTGQVAPEFDLPGSGLERVSLSAFRGSNVVLFFYPKDDSQGCTAEALEFTALKPEFDKTGTVLIGISPDSVALHDKFRTKHGLDLILAADEDKSVLQTYGVWKEKSMYGRKFMGVERTTLLIDREGKILRIWPKVKVRGHAEQVLEAARAL
jgi:peroxiredoxin Q/BCP